MPPRSCLQHMWVVSEQTSREGGHHEGTQRDAPSIRCRIFRASRTVLSWKQCSRPGTPCVLLVEPTAMTSLSYLRRHTPSQLVCPRTARAHGPLQYV